MITQAEHIETFIKGSIMGLLIGDAIGYAYQFQKDIPVEIDMINGPGNWGIGSYTSFSAIALCTMASINDYMDEDEIDSENLLEKFNDLLLGNYLAAGKDCVELGSIITEAITRFTNGLPPDRCGTNKTNDNECFSRILPIALHTIHLTPKEIVSIIINACNITHTHLRVHVCCILYAFIIRNLLLQKSEKIFETAKEIFSDSEEYLKELTYIKNWKKDNKCSGSTQVEDCFWSMWDAYSYIDGYKFVVDESIRYRNCSHVTAALAGSISALANGLNDIPYKWLHTVSMSSEVMEIVNIFTQNVVNKVIRIN